MIVISGSEKHNLLIFNFVLLLLKGKVMPLISKGNDPYIPLSHHCRERIHRGNGDRKEIQRKNQRNNRRA